MVAALLTIACLAFAGAGWAVFAGLKGEEPWPRIDTLQEELIGQNSVVYAADGSRMGVIRSDENRTWVALARMGAWAPKATVAIEDRRFYSHDGVDPEAIARAMMRNVEAGYSAEGGSTITQQVVRNLYSEITREKSYQRKAKEATLALELEQKYMGEAEGDGKDDPKQAAKNRILEMYMNLVFYGRNAYGIEAAARTYFSKPASKLNLAEGALLAGLPQRPSEYDPLTQPEVAKVRRDEVLRAMLDMGSITRDQYEKAVAAPIKLKLGNYYRERRLPYFFDYVEKRLIDEYGTTTVRKGGLKIKTTIDPRLQTIAEDTLRNTLNQPGDPAAAMVVLDTKSGEIRAMAGSTDYESSKFNLASQGRRQPGSSAKTWVLAAFLKQGIDPNSTSYTSQPIKVRPTGSTEWWEPKTYSNTYSGGMSVRSATIASDNSVYAQMTLDIGPETVAETARELGVESDLKPVWSIGLGAQEVTPLEQTNFYATIARGGVRKDPVAVKELTRAVGDPVALKPSKPKRVMEDWQAREIISILEANVQGGTGTAAGTVPYAAGKTGTTDAHNDAWFCGMTPKLTACVWMGYADATRSMYSVHGVTVAGGTFPAQMWGAFMAAALEGVDMPEWYTPESEPVWSYFTSTWRDNPAIESIVIEPPKEEDEKDKDKDKKKADGDSDAKAERPEPEPQPDPKPEPKPDPTPAAPGGGAKPAPAPPPPPPAPAPGGGGGAGAGGAPPTP